MIKDNVIKDNVNRSLYKNMLIFPLILLFKLSCDLSYIFSVHEIYNYMFYYLEFDVIKYMLSWVFTIILSLRFYKAFSVKIPKFTTIFVFCLYLLSYIPSATLFGCMDLPYGYIFSFTLYWGLILILEYVFIARRSENNRKVFRCATSFQYAIQNTFKNERLKRLLKNGIIAVSCLLVLYFSYHYVGLKINLNLMEAYDLRYGAIRDISGVMHYIYIWVGLIVAYFAINSFLKKKYVMFLVYLFLMIIYYSIEGNRTIFFLIPVSIIAYFILKKPRFWLIPLAFTLLNFASIFETTFTSNVYLTGFWGMRTLFTPPMLSTVYFDFFSTHPVDMLSQSIMRYFGVVSIYPESIPNMLNVLYFNGDLSGSVNTGLFGDAFANFGYSGAVIYPFIMLFIFKLMNFITKDQKYFMNMFLLIYYIIAFSNAAPFTVLLTNGFLVLGAIIKLFGLKNEELDLKTSRTRNICHQKTVLKTN